MQDLNETPSKPDALSLVLIKLMKGVVYLDEDPSLWQDLLNLQNSVRDYIKVIGLELSLIEDEGVAWLSTRTCLEGDSELPSLVGRRKLSFPVSLLLALLRRKLVEHDATSGEQRLILKKEELIEEFRIFMPQSSNDSKLVDKVTTYINKIIELGFLRRLENDSETLEVRRIIKAFVDAQWLNEFEKRLKEYAIYCGHEPVEE